MYQAIVLSLYIDGHGVLSCAQVSMLDLFNHVEEGNFGRGGLLGSIIVHSFHVKCANYQKVFFLLCRHLNASFCTVITLGYIKH